MQNDKVLSYNKAFQHISLNLDGDVDPTSIRIGKQRVARNKPKNLSALKEAIVLHRSTAKAAIEVPVTIDFTSEMAVDVISHSPIRSADFDFEEIDRLSEVVLKELARLQAKGKDQPPEKQYKYKKFVVGVREVSRALRRNEVKGIIVARNVEEEVEEVAQLLSQMRSDCHEKELSMFSALTKRKIGKCLNKSMKQTIVGILNLDGIHQQWKELKKHTE